MAYTSGFFDAVDQGGGNYDRVYSAASFAHYFSLLVKNGVFPDPSTGMQVKASSNPDMHVSVQPGNGWVSGYYITVEANAPEQLTVPTANPSLSRIDSVIMGLNYVDREIQLYIKSGAVSASPSAVSLQRDNDLYELELAQITVSAGMASITQANITDMRQNTSRCGIVAGTIDQIDTTDLFAQYNTAFQTWFDNLKAQLGDNVAANLQKQINAINEKQKAEGVYFQAALPYTNLVDSSGNKLKTPEGWQLGDVINTARTNLGSSWLLCNGDYILPKSYSTLCSLMEYAWTFNSHIYNNTEIAKEHPADYTSGLFRTNNRLVIFFISSGIAYSAIKPDGEDWAIHSTTGLPSSVVSSVSDAIRLQYLNGKYILFNTSQGRISYDTTSITSLYESTDLINWSSMTVPVTPWTSEANSYNNKTVTALVEAPDGTILMVLQRHSEAYSGNYAVSTSLEAGFSFPKNQDFRAYDEFSIQVSYANGKFFVVYYNSSSGSSVTIIDIAIYDITTQTWATSSISYSNSTRKGLSKVIYAEGSYLFVGGAGKLYLSPDGVTWSDKNYINLFYGLSLPVIETLLYKNKQTLVVIGLSDTYVSGSSSGNCTLYAYLIDLSSKTATRISNENIYSNWTGSIKSICATEEGLVLYIHNANSKTLLYAGFDGYDVVKLPNISMDSVYTYIRALEE